MALGVDQAVAELIRDGDPIRSVLGLDAIEGFRLYDDADVTKRRIHIGEEPPDPDDVVTVVLEGGLAPIGGGQPNAVGRRPGFTVRARSQDSEMALTRAHNVHAILDYFEGEVRGIPFFRIFAEFEPTPLGRDSGDRGGRWITSQTFRSVTKRYALS